MESTSITERPKRQKREFAPLYASDDAHKKKQKTKTNNNGARFALSRRAAVKQGKAARVNGLRVLPTLRRDVLLFRLSKSSLQGYLIKFHTFRTPCNIDRITGNQVYSRSLRDNFRQKTKKKTKDS